MWTGSEFRFVCIPSEISNAALADVRRASPDYKGPSYSDVINLVQPAGYCGLAINGTDPDSMAPMPANWYQTYCAQKPTKACMFSESGAAFHVNDAGASHLALQQGW